MDPREKKLSPLIKAVQAGDLCALFETILAGAEINEQDADGWTALTHACYQGEYQIAFQLLDSGTSPNLHDSHSMMDNPLSIAAWHGHFDIVRLLIAHGADPDTWSGIWDLRAKGYARREGHHEISEFLLYHEGKGPGVRTSFPPNR